MVKLYGWTAILNRPYINVYFKMEMPVSFPWLFSKAILFGHGQLCKIHVHGFQRSFLLVYLKFPASLLQRIFTLCGCFMHFQIKPIRAWLLTSKLLKKSNKYSCKVRNLPFVLLFALMAAHRSTFTVWESL